MVEDKVGQKPYLGIEINYDKEKKLDKVMVVEQSIPPE